MHELSIAQSILSIAEKAAPPAGEGIVTAINIKVGELSSIEMEALKFAFCAVKEDTVLQKAELHIEMIPGEANCLDCGITFHLPAFGQPCPQCSSFSLKITGGREMKVTSLTVEE
jgi:hydrogenase nickel incorporation protein HypA/HybF